MKSIIATLVISALVLSLMLMGIDLWRGNLELIRLSAIKVNEMEKIKETDLLPLDQDEYTGGDVISIIRYYSITEEVEVEVILEGVTKRYRQESYQQDLFYIPYEGKFSKQTFYEGKRLKKISFQGK